jgi:homoserine dehydrogenase
MNMNKKIRVALLGLGEVGELFAERLLAKIQESKLPIEIVAVADRNTESPVALGFRHSGVQVFKHAFEVVKLGDHVDIIFDLTGDPMVRRALRMQMQESENRHTVIAPEVVAKLLYMFFFEETQFPAKHNGRGGY